MTTTMIETMCGSENFPGMQSKVYLFYTPSYAFPNPMGEQQLFAAAKTGLHGVSALRAGGRINAHENGDTNAGFFTKSDYAIPEGMILKLFAMRKVGTGLPHVGSVFLRARATAALRRYEVALTGFNRATLRNGYVEGRFDVLSLAQAKALGVRVNPLHEKQFNPVTARAMITPKDLSPEIAAAPVLDKRTIENAEGQAVEVTRVRSKRSLDLS